MNPAQWLGPCSLLADCPNAQCLLSAWTSEGRSPRTLTLCSRLYSMPTVCLLLAVCPLPQYLLLALTFLFQVLLLRPFVYKPDLFALPSRGAISLVFP